jgi:NAD(P)H-quinone oxidoreductase subunit 5
MSYLLLSVLPATSLLAALFVPNSLANARVRGFRRCVTGLAAIQAIVSLLMLVGFATGLNGGGEWTWSAAAGASPFAISITYDGVSGLMLALVGSVGWVICRYSQRYLDGEAGQGRYFRWTAVTLGAVSLMVVSANLLMFIAAWITTSLGLHQLLLHYSDRAAARGAAHWKFVVSRIGDVSLISAAVLLFLEFQTLEFSKLFALIQADEFVVSPTLVVVNLLIVLGAVTKSAQFPFHTWLPNTMETPTPVSALMHAGIVNAGGYLLIRLSPLVSQTPGVLAMLAVIGAITACYGGIVMATQSSIKKTLAYSTIAQMGFMMLQCGLGAFTAAMLHIIAHSLYKAHAFLTSGSVIKERSAKQFPASKPVPVGATVLLGAAAINTAFLVAAGILFGIDFAAKPGAYLLGGILCLALTAWLAQIIRVGDLRLLTRGIVACGILCLSYSASFVAVDRLTAGSLASTASAFSPWPVAILVTLGFVGVFALQFMQASQSRALWLRNLYVHASNGFYIETWLRNRLSQAQAT